MIDRKALLADLQKQVKALEKDLRGQAETATEITASNGAAAPARKVRDRLHAEYDLAFKLGRTAATWTAWRDERVTQAAAAWVLGTVFVRFCEDNGLLTSPYLAGPSTERMVLAEEAQEEFFRVNPAETDRGWLLAAFGEIGGSQAGALLFDRKHNPLYQIPVSHDAAKELIAFWRRRGEDGRLVHDFVSDDWDTRFLGDLYQDLSEAARKTYALLQTPEFVEEFILDYTLTPAIAEFGHEELRMIDPTCGSGHFVLGAFHRLLAEWVRHAPTRDARELVRLALKSVHGVDLNPFAIAIARFRLFIAALKASGFTTLDEAKPYEFPLNLAIGDSLIKARQLAIPGMESEAAVLRGATDQGALFTTPNEQGDLFAQSEEPVEPTPRDELAEFAYDTEDVHSFPRILTTGTYHVVVGNPPYITVKDKKLNDLYRELYDACSGQYALSIPFAQRFFELACTSDEDGRNAGYVGQITANSFMKREFGRKFIEQYLAHDIELSHVIDTSGAYIPGHGTPTIVLFGKNKRWKRAPTIRAVLGIRGEPGPPQDPSQGHVWQAITSQVNKPGSSSVWLSVSDIPRRKLATYPWSLAGGGAAEAKESIESGAVQRLETKAATGVATTTGDDEAFLVPGHFKKRFPDLPTSTIIEGDEVRDYTISENTLTVWPYTNNLETLSLTTSLLKWFWPNRRSLQRRKRFSVAIENIEQIAWYEYRELYRSKLDTPELIAFSTVATHNHFVFSGEKRVFNRHAPVIKLRTRAIRDQHLELTAILNSSTACFWLKQVSHDKGSQGVNEGFKSQEWERFYEFTGTKLRSFPLPAKLPLNRGSYMAEIAQQLLSVSPSNMKAQIVPNHEGLRLVRNEWHSLRLQMITLQEELDWEVYSLYGLLDEELTAPVEVVPELRLGERAFEIVLARRMARGEVETQWFARHGSTPITELPEHWAPEYKAVVERRIALIETDRNIGLIERPEYKRRWATEGWDSLQAKALRSWLLDRCEARELWFHDVDGIPDQPRMLSTAQLADLLRPDADFVSVAELYAPGKELDKVVAELVADEHVPYLAQLRYKDSGLDKRADWEDVWDRQRHEDAAQSVADAAKEAADQQRKIAEAAQKSGDETAAKHAFDEWAELDARYRALEAEVERIRNAIPVPPKYGSGDFLKNSYWRNRGKLDVAKERFISYPHASRDGDPTLLLGWAGWDHREQAQALATAIVDREQNHGWQADRLAPLLAGLREVLPWVRQWHDDFDPHYSGTPADVYEGFLNQTRDRLNLGDDDLTAWRPPKTSRTRRSA
ncbi:BREX-2 system adenine-specific DNA-methyltransferase PglX [Sphaerisporangium rhizosphaerae]|uniref:site-specific DNA-methyltransferase (adenine-specific) n=1 Tax=Sphaerisporangium rhizosphaerae TaxID=2269375 RepID=A0ABW2NZG9_9ACTN